MSSPGLELVSLCLARCFKTLRQVETLVQISVKACRIFLFFECLVWLVHLSLSLSLVLPDSNLCCYYSLLSIATCITYQSRQINSCSWMKWFVVCWKQDERFYFITRYLHRNIFILENWGKFFWLGLIRLLILKSFKSSFLRAIQ